MSVGKVMSEPEPTMELTAPAAMPAHATAMAESQVRCGVTWEGLALAGVRLNHRRSSGVPSVRHKGGQVPTCGAHEAQNEPGLALIAAPLWGAGR